MKTRDIDGKILKTMKFIFEVLQVAYKMVNRLLYWHCYYYYYYYHCYY